MFQFGPLQEVIGLLQLSPDEVTILQDDLISYLKVHMLAVSWQSVTNSAVVAMADQG